jgi:glycosyltransferase involved in cell wall biosynthesis
VDVGRFAGGDRQAARRTLRLPAHAVVVGTVGRLDPVKDHAGLLRAFSVLRTDQPAAELVVVGDGPCRPDLERLIHELGLTGHTCTCWACARMSRSSSGRSTPSVLPSLAEGI